MLNLDNRHILQDTFSFVTETELYPSPYVGTKHGSDCVMM